MSLPAILVSEVVRTPGQADKVAFNTASKVTATALGAGLYFALHGPAFVGLMAIQSGESWPPCWPWRRLSRCHVSSSPDRGSTFALSLQHAAAPEIAFDPSPPSSPTPRRRPPAWR